MIVDANVWVSAFIREDVFHRRSRLWFRSMSESGVTTAVPSFGLVEVAGAIARIQNSPQRGLRVARWIAASPAIQIIPMQPVLVEKAIELASNYQLRGADAVYVAAAYELGVSLVTWDAEMLARALGIVDVVQPAL